MSDEKTDVLVAGYQEIETATKDFESLVACVKDKRVEIEGVILVTHDADGKCRVRQTGDHLGRKGAGWGGGVAWPSACSRRRCSPPSAVGAAAGGVVGKFAEHRRRERLHDKIGREAAARDGRDHRRVRRRAAARGRAGARRRAGEVGGADGQERASGR